MKEFTEEQMGFFRTLSQEMQDQDPLCTEHPIYCVYHQVAQLVPDGYSYDRVVFIKDGEAIDTIEDEENECDITITDENYEEFDGVEMLFEKDIPTLANSHLTRKAAELHIAQNGYHYNDPFVFVNSMWRCYEMIELRKIILSLTEGNEKVHPTPPVVEALMENLKKTLGA